MSKRIFLAATKQNDGKTTLALGLIFNLQKKLKHIGFVKPIGQRYLEEEGVKVDEDSVLIEKVAGACGIRCSIKDMSPVAVEKGFTEKYILRPDRKEITKQIKESFRRVAKGQDAVIIEGTGHAGVGSVFDHSNAYVAKLLHSKVIIISSGGIGRPIDEILLNQALFEREGVKIAGVIVNKVLPEKFAKINKLVRMGLVRKDIEVLGVIPYYPELSYPTIRQILEETDFKLLCAQNALSNRVSKVVVGAMQPKEAIKYFVDQFLLITPADRLDMLNAAVDTHRQELRLSGVILSGGLLPDKGLLDTFEAKGIPVLFSKLDTYSVASLIHDLTVKIQPQDKEKIEAVVKSVGEYVDINRLLKLM